MHLFLYGSKCYKRGLSFMHELSLCENILYSIEETARNEGVKTVSAVHLCIGALSCVEPEALRFCFDAVTEGSIAENSCLTIDIQPGRAVCNHCDASLTIENYFDACSQCGSFDLEIIDGQQMQISSLEVI